MVLHLIPLLVLLIGLCLHAWGPTPKAQAVGLAMFTAGLIALLVTLPIAAERAAITIDRTH